MMELPLRLGGGGEAMGPFGPDPNCCLFVLVIGGEWPKRYALPPLNVAGAPVVCQYISKYPPLGLLGVHGPAERLTAPAAKPMHYLCS